MGMNILKSFYWNYQTKLYYLAKKTFYNLNSKQCESSYIILLSCNLNIVEFNKTLHNIMDDDCYIVDDKKLSKNNNMTVPTTAPETTATTSGYNTCSSSSSLSSVRSSRRREQRNYKESTSVNLINRHSSNPCVSVTNRTNETNFVWNQFAFNYFINYHSFYQSRGLAFVVPYSLNEQRYNNSTKRFRNACLFSEQNTTDGFDNQLNRNVSSNALRSVDDKDKEAIADLRSWIPVKENSESKPGTKFTLMSYNVLAQDLLVEHQYLYRRHKPRALLWENRWKKLNQEILENDPDIICLQEVQQDHLKDYFSQFLNKGYAHLYKKKTGMRSDGCAIYYKKSVFKLLEHTTVEYNQQYPVLDRDNVAIIAKFAPVNNINSEFVVATTHLLYNPRREDVRLAQTQILLAEIDRIAYKGQENAKYTPVIITGDFNTEPDSAVYSFLVNGNLKYDTLTNRSLKYNNSTTKLEGKILIPSVLRITDNCQHMDLIKQRLSGEKITKDKELQLIHIRHNKRQEPTGKGPDDESLFSTGVLSHDFKLQSAFLHKTNSDTEGTTYQNKWITVDYIFYSGAFNEDLNKKTEGKLKLISRYSIPSTTELSSRVLHIPNFALGSDHLALLAKFNLEY